MLLLTCLLLILYTQASTIIQDQGGALCDLLASTNIGSLRDQGNFIGWRCEYSADYGGNLPYEDNSITVCGNRFLDCNSTMIGASGCSDKYTNTTQLEPWTGIVCDTSNPFNIKYLISEINLSGRSITGNIPESIGLISSLRVLDLSSNSMSGAIHSMITRFANNAAVYLEKLRLESNSFSSTVPSTIGTITTIESLGLAKNSLSGVLPTEINALTKLTAIEINNNQFSGNFPETIFYLPALETINADTNRLTGLPTLTLTVPFLRSAKFSNNDITTAVLDVAMWGNNMPEAHTIHLHNNDLTGTISGSSLTHFQKLQEMLVYSNKLTGTLPPQLGTLTRLETLDLGSNLLTSTIPNEISSASNLQHLSLDSNGLTGQLTYAALSPLTRLVTLELQSNSLTSTLPAGAFDMKF